MYIQEDVHSGISITARVSTHVYMYNCIYIQIHVHVYMYTYTRVCAHRVSYRGGNTPPPYTKFLPLECE